MGPQGADAAAGEVGMDISYHEINFSEPLGTGSFGAVFRGTVRGTEVAVKKCRLSDDGAVKQLRLEIRHLQRLQHSRLVSFMGCCLQPPFVVLIMEYMPGGSLHHLLFKRKRTLEFEQQRTMAWQIAEGISYLHNNGVVHRDLKTLNVILDADLNAKICDFGLTIALENSHVTVQGLAGSPRYMAPEQFEDKVRITDRVDIWQMGCLMMELFCGVTPFASAKGLQQIAAQLLVRRQAPTIPPTCDARARCLIAACTRLQPQRRPPAAVLVEALAGLADA